MALCSGETWLKSRCNEKNAYVTINPVEHTTTYAVDVPVANHPAAIIALVGCVLAGEYRPYSSSQYAGNFHFGDHQRFVALSPYESFPERSAYQFVRDILAV